MKNEGKPGRIDTDERHNNCLRLDVILTVVHFFMGKTMLFANKLLETDDC